MRTDSQIQKDVMDELKWEPQLHATEIGVAVKEGVVTLSGTVDSYGKKRAAEKAASRVMGVRAIAEDIDVKIFSIWKKTDTEIASAIVDALTWQSSVDEQKIRAKVEDGWVTLEGEVEWDFQRNSAWHAVQNLMGVRGITNLITISPRVKMQDVREKIGNAFRRRAGIDAAEIQIDTMGDKVTLSGKVRSLAEKRDAGSAAWAAPGVKHVENRLIVEYAEALVM